MTTDDVTESPREDQLGEKNKEAESSGANKDGIDNSGEHDNIDKTGADKDGADNPRENQVAGTTGATPEFVAQMQAMLEMMMKRSAEQYLRDAVTDSERRAIASRARGRGSSLTRRPTRRFEPTVLNFSMPTGEQRIRGLPPIHPSCTPVEPNMIADASAADKSPPVINIDDN